MRFNDLCGVYKEAFDFCFEKASLLGDKAGINFDSVLAKVKKSDIYIESSPFFIIIKCIRDVLSNHPVSKSVYINVNHGESISNLRIPTVFIMHFCDEKLVEIEFFTLIQAQWILMKFS